VSATLEMKGAKAVAPRPAANRLTTVVDLFAGCGGLSLGLENAGFTPVFVNELNQDALSTYLSNRFHSLGGLKFSENEMLHCRDVGELNTRQLERLSNDLAQIPEINFRRELRASARAGGGSNLDLVAGGPPCQGYSGIGHRRSYSVDKIDLPSNLLYAHMARVIRTLRPRAFLFENVRGLLTSRWSATGDRIWPDVLAEFRAIEGYTVRWSLVHAKDYGVPQNRPRVLMVGLRDDWWPRADVSPGADPEDAVQCGFLPPARKGEFPDLAELLDDLIDPAVDDILRSGNYPDDFQTHTYQRSARTEIQRKLRSLPAHLPNSQARKLTEQEYSRHAPAVVKKFSYMLDHGGRIPPRYQTKKFAQRVLPAEWDVAGPTITATSLPDDYVHYAQPRILTVREWARLQMFPDWYQFSGKRTTGGLRRAGNPREGIFEREVPKYTQIGNAVPVELARRVGQHLRGLIRGVFG